MNKKTLAIAATFISLAITLLFLFYLLEKDTPVPSASAQVLAQDVPTITIVEPASAPNDLDIPVVITGTGFTAGLSGTVVITQPAVWLGEVQLSDATWVSTTTLTATVPWGMDPGGYTLTVINPDKAIVRLPNAFTVTEGINTWATGGPYGGSIYTLALGESGLHTVYATVINVGLFRSRTGGASWELIFNEIGWENAAEVDPTNPDRIYIAKRSKGLYRSEDGGDTWTALPLPMPDVRPYRLRAFVNPHDGTLFGALSSGSYGHTCNYGCGLFKYSEAGRTWQSLQTTGVLTEGTAVTSVGFDPVNSQIMYVGRRDGVVVTSVDGGQTWASLGQTPLHYISKLFVNPIGNHEPWVCGSADGQNGGLYKYNSGSWTTVYDTNVSDLVFDPAATDVISQTIWIGADQGVMQSQDGGQNWNLLSLGYFGVKAIALNPANRQVIYSGRNGVTATSDGGASWQTSNQGLAGLVPQWLAVNPYNPTLVYAAVDSGLYGSRNGGGAWERLAESWGGPIVVDPANSNHVIASNGHEVLIADDGWHFNRQVTVPLPAGMSDQFYTPLITALVARSNFWLMGVGYWDNRLPYMNYEGGGGIYTSQDGEHWIEAASGQTPYAVTSVGLDLLDTNVVYAATNGGGHPSGSGISFFKSTDNGQTWLPSVTGLPLQNMQSDAYMAIEPAPPYRIILCSGNGFHISTDQGASWSNIDRPPEFNSDTPVNSMLYIQGQPPVLYVASTIGLFRSMDGAHTWQRAHGTLGQLEIWSMAGAVTSDRQVFYAATIGGMTNGSQAQAMHLASSNETLVSAGVYRYTTPLLTQHIYLPLAFR